MNETCLKDKSDVRSTFFNDFCHLGFPLNWQCNSLATAKQRLNHAFNVCICFNANNTFQ